MGLCVGLEFDSRAESNRKGGQIMGKLTAAFVRSVAKAGRYGDGDTLFLRVTPSGSRSWIQRLTIEGRRHDVGLGPFPVVSLDKARRRAFENRVAIADGRNPLAEKRRAKSPTFAEAAERTLEATRARWRTGGKTEKIWRQVLSQRALPAFGDRPVDAITREDVLRIVSPIWSSKPEVARRLRQFVRSILSWAQAHGHVATNVAGEGLDGALPAMRRLKQHLRALPYAEVGAALETVQGDTAARLCLQLVILTAVRSGEARAATWDEIDIEARTWTIPATRMKAGAEHRVPLSDAAVAVLDKARVLADGSPLVFPSPMKRGHSLSDMALTKMLRDSDLAERTTVHGFRSSFRDWCAETGKPREIAEAALAHTVGGVEGAYFRSDLFERRRWLMGAWAAFLAGDRAKVVAIR